jgi:hypothetical protein
MKALNFVVGSSVVAATIIASTLSASAGQTCTTDGKTWECKDDGKESNQPSCVNKGPFECSEPAPAGFVPGFTYTIREFVFPDTGKPPEGDGSGSRTLWEPTEVGEQFANKVNIELALLCPAGSKSATDEKGSTYCQSLDIAG